MTINNKYWKIKQYKIIELLGTGLSSKVYLCLNLKNFKYYAIKIFKRLISKEFISNEIYLLTKMKHKNLINLIDYGKENLISLKKNKLVNFIVFELLNSGELFDYLNFKNFPSDISIHYFKQMLILLKYLKENNFYHRDLKPENILFDDKFNLKLIDFGFSTINKHNTNLNNYCGSDHYLAPEIIERKKYKGYETDLFSLGVIFYIMYTSKIPFIEAKRSCQFYNLIINNKFDKFWEIQKKFNPEINFTTDFKNLMEKMFQYNPGNRWNVDEILNLEYIKNRSIKPYKLQLFMEKRRQWISLKDVNFIHNKTLHKKLKKRNSL